MSEFESEVQNVETPVEETPAEEVAAAEEAPAVEEAPAAPEPVEEPVEEPVQAVASPEPVVEETPVETKRFSTGAAVAPPPAKRGEKVTDPDELIQLISQNDPGYSWGLFTYNKNKLEIFAHGNGDAEEMREQLDNAQVLYAYLRLGVGAEQRTKFVYIRWVGEHVRPMQRAGALEGGKAVGKIFKVFHADYSFNQRSEIVQKQLLDRLAKAAGANYDKTQNEGSKNSEKGQFDSYKRTSRNFFAEIEKQGNVQIAYNKGPMARSTPWDISSRPLTVGAAAKKNTIVDLSTKK